MATKKVAAKKASTKKVVKKITKEVVLDSKKTTSKKLFKNKVDTIALSSEAAKLKATKDGIPYVQVLGIELDPSNPTFGAFTLDWNSLFIKQLRAIGYSGDTDEKIIDQWFQKICHHVYANTYENDQAQVPGNGRRPQRTPLSDGRVVVS